MYIYSAEEISELIFPLPKGSVFSIKGQSLELSLSTGEKIIFPVTTAIFLRMAIERNEVFIYFPYWMITNQELLVEIKKTL